MLSKLRVRTKLLVLLLVPMLALAILTTAFTVDRFDQRTSAETDVRLASALRAVSAADTELGSERLLATGVMGGGDQALQNEYVAQRPKSDEAVRTAVTELDAVESRVDNPDLTREIARLKADVGRMTEIRAEVEDPKATVPGMVDEYTTLTSRLGDLAVLLGSASSGGTAIDDAAILVQARSAESAEAAFVAAQLGNPKRVGPDDRLTALTEARSQQQVAASLRSTYQNNLAGTEDRKDLSRAIRDKRYRDSVAPFNAVAEGTAAADLGMSLDDFVSVAGDRAAVLATAQQQIISRLDQSARLEASSASLAAKLGVGLAVLGFLLAAGIAIAVARSISGPLLTLVRATNSLNSETLPALVDSMARPDIPPPAVTPIEVKSQDEIGELATALNSLQSTAVEVSQRQGDVLKRGISDIFVNLARRNQSLLDRQIEFIDRLEATEEDPEQLERLFRLDHLATRMRRNAESLLVLAGAEQTRRRTRDVSLRDVVRVAIGEVEDYRRIEISHLDEVMVTGTVAIDLAHLLSELMENGTQYSPPETTVDVVGRVGSDGRYFLTVTDRGVGMADAQMGSANAVLNRPPAVALNVGRALGFVVVSSLAARHSIQVRLSAGDSGGTVATVMLAPQSFRTPVERSGGRTTSVPPIDHLPTAHQVRPAAAAPVTPYGDPEWTPGAVAPAGPMPNRRAPEPTPVVTATTPPPSADTAPPAYPTPPVLAPAAEPAPVAEWQSDIAEPVSPAAMDRYATAEPAGWDAPSPIAADFGSDTQWNQAEAAVHDDAGSWGDDQWADANWNDHSWGQSDPGADWADHREAAAPSATSAPTPAAFARDETFQPVLPSDTPEIGYGLEGVDIVPMDEAFAPADAFMPPEPEALEPGRPAQLDEAVPLGRAFEMGIYSLLDEGAPAGLNEAAAPSLPAMPPMGALPSHTSESSFGNDAFTDAPSADETEDPKVKQLPRRDPVAAAPQIPADDVHPVGVSRRSPQEVASMLSRYRAERDRGRADTASTEHDEI